LLWALPFAFVLIGGLFSDFFETRGAQFAAAAALAMVVAQWIFCLALLAGIQNFT
jgi:hypothetical protein